jgi:hypothetical protein
VDRNFESKTNILSSQPLPRLSRVQFNHFNIDRFVYRARSFIL